MTKRLICCNFEKLVLVDDQQPVGFQEWATLITHDKCRFTLPDGTSYDTKIFVDLINNFDSGAYTTFLENRYKELYEN